MESRESELRITPEREEIDEGNFIDEDVRSPDPLLLSY